MLWRDCKSSNDLDPSELIVDKWLFKDLKSLQIIEKLINTFRQDFLLGYTYIYM